MLLKGRTLQLSLGLCGRDGERCGKWTLVSTEAVQPHGNNSATRPLKVQGKCFGRVLLSSVKHVYRAFQHSSCSLAVPTSTRSHPDVLPASVTVPARYLTF